MKKYFLTILIVAVFISATLTQNARAYAGMLDVGIDPVTGVTTAGSWVTELTDLGSKIGKWVVETVAANLLIGIKIAALMTVQLATSMIIGGPKGDSIVRDYNSYLHIGPEQRAMAQMNTFFNTVSRGRSSTLNYEGVSGNNYNGYMRREGERAIAGSGFETNLQDFVAGPRQMFDSGNMRGITAYMECANNVACFTLASVAKYNNEVAKAKEVAKTEVTSSGFAPRKENGRITSPAALAQNALTQMDELGTKIIMNAPTDKNADKSSSIIQIAQGAAISLGARLTNYAVSDEKGKAALRNKNDQFPFSLAYSSVGGVGFNAGGVTVDTGVGKWGGQTMVGNTCVAGGFVVDSKGANVVVDGKKQTCTPATAGSITGPSVTNLALPTITCTPDTPVGDSACEAFGAFRCGSNGRCEPYAFDP